MLTSDEPAALTRWISLAAERDLLPPPAVPRVRDLADMVLGLARDRVRGESTAATATATSATDATTAPVWDDAFVATRYEDERMGM